MKVDSRTMAVVAALLGGFVVVSEIPYWTSRSSLAPVLTALGLGVIALALAVWRSGGK
jgi:hypothetical protein